MNVCTVQIQQQGKLLMYVKCMTLYKNNDTYIYKVCNVSTLAESDDNDLFASNDLPTLCTGITGQVLLKTEE